MCFVDFEKAFDRIRHEVLVERLEQVGDDTADIRPMINLYWNQKAVVRIGDNRSDWIKIKRGVRQGCVLFPDLFLLYSQVIIDEIEDLEGITIGGININNIKCADDTVLIADSEDKLQSLVDRLDVECSTIGLKINIGKTEVMGVTKRTEQLRVRVNINGETVKQANSFRFL